MFAPTVLLWEAFVSFAMLGFGSGLLRLFRLQRLPVAVAASAGVAGWLLLGGWLNLAHLATGAVIRCLFAAGALLFLRELFRKDMRLRLGACLPSARSHRVACFFAIPVIVYFLLMFAAHLRPAGWSWDDDQQGYMALSEKGAAYDHLPSDPFSERRTASGWGGGIFLDRTMLAGADDSAMDYLDSGFGYLAYVLAIWSMGGALRLSSAGRVVLLYLVPLFPLGKVNMTIVFLSASFFMSMLLLLFDEDWEDAGREEAARPGVAVVLGLLLGAAFTLKATNIPFGFLFIVCLAASLVWYRRRVRGLLRPAALVAALVLLAVLPWMAALHHEQGTYLFPALGRGYHISAYGLLPLPSNASPKFQSFVIALPPMLLLFVAGGLTLVLSRGWATAVRLPLLAVFVAALASTPVTALSTGGQEVDRYTLPYIMPCVLLLAGCTLFAWRRVSGVSVPRLYAGSATVMVVACAWASDALIRRTYGLNNDAQEMWTLTGQTRQLNGYRAKLDPGTMRANALAVRRAQEAAPAGATILELTATAYGYDWKRNTVYIGDYPGMSGPPPGPPLTGTAEEMRRYLLGCGVHYVIYERSLYVPVHFDALLQHPEVRLIRGDLKLAAERRLYLWVWSRQEWLVENRFRGLIGEIAQPQRRIYDDGRIATIRLD